MTEKEPSDEDSTDRTEEEIDGIVESETDELSEEEDEEGEEVEISEEELIEKEDEEEEALQEVRRFRRCQRRRKIRPPLMLELLDMDEEEDEEEYEELSYDEDREEDEESEEGVKSSLSSDYGSVLSAVQFEWERKTYEFLDLCDPGTIDDIYRKKPEKPLYDDEFGQKSYLKVCDNLGSTPIVRFYYALTTPTADLSFHGIDKKQMWAISKAMENNVTVEKLILRGNPLCIGSCQALSTLLARNSNIVHLDLSRCRIGPEGAELLANGLRLTYTLVTLNLSKCYIEDEGMKYIVIPLKDNKLIETIILSWNYLTGEAAEALGSLFNQNNTIKELDLGYNRLCEPVSMKKFFKGLGENTSISVLTLKWNAISMDEIGEAISRYLRKSSSIKYLDLSDNRLYGSSLKRLGKALAGNEGLEILKLGRNPLTSEDVESFLPGVKTNPTLQLLDLEDIWVTKEFVKSLNKIKKTKDVSVIYGGVYSDYILIGPDYSALLLKRARYEAMKPKKAKQKKELGNFLFTLDETPVPATSFLEQLKKFKAKINPKLLPELIKQFTIPKVNLVDVVGMRNKFLSIFSDFTPPEKPGEGVEQEEKKKKKKKKKEEKTGEKKKEETKKKKTRDKQREGSEKQEEIQETQEETQEEHKEIHHEEDKGKSESEAPPEVTHYR